MSNDSGTRCDVCNWPLAASVAEGCVPGNCSQRPRPKVRQIVTAEHANDCKRCGGTGSEPRGLQTNDGTEACPTCLNAASGSTLKAVRDLRAALATEQEARRKAEADLLALTRKTCIDIDFTCPECFVDYDNAVVVHSHATGACDETLAGPNLRDLDAPKGGET
jgi:hypothetical protein